MTLAPVITNIVINKLKLHTRSMQGQCQGTQINNLRRNIRKAETIKHSPTAIKLRL